jgi:hypothetical protein
LFRISSVDCDGDVHVGFGFSVIGDWG